MPCKLHKGFSQKAHQNFCIIFVRIRLMMCLGRSKLKLGTTNMNIKHAVFEKAYEKIKFTDETPLRQILIQMVKKDV